MNLFITDIRLQCTYPTVDHFKQYSSSRDGRTRHNLHLLSVKLLRKFKARKIWIMESYLFLWK